MIKVEPQSAVARLRAKNQLTLPEPIASALGVSPGDRFRVSVHEGVVHLTPLPKSYYGALKGLWPDDWMDELRQGREEWSEREKW